MKTIFRYSTLAILIAVFIALGTVAGMAQDPTTTPTPGPCEQAEAIATLDAKFRDNYKGTLAQRKIAVEAGKQYIEKYGSCELSAEFVKYLKTKVPTMETAIIEEEKALEEAALTKPFDAALKAKNWDDVYSYGKQILAKYPEKFRTVEIVLGSIGYDEASKGNNKYNDDTLKYAKISIADLEAGKPFVLGKDTRYGLSLKGVYNFEYSSKDDALGWMNLIIGYITGVAQKNKPASLPYLFKATQSASVTADSTAKNPIPYELIGYYYFEEYDKLTAELPAMVADQLITDTPEVAKQKADAIKAKIALANGMLERAMDSFSRAYTFAASTPAAKAYKDKMKSKVESAYNIRFSKTTGLDAWIAESVKKPFANPTTPVMPIFDPEPASTTTTTTTATPPVKPGTTTTKPAVTPAKPAATPAAKPANGAKPQAKAKKPVAKKRGA